MDREAEETDALQPRLCHGLARILDPIGARIGILIVRLPVRQQEKQPEAGPLTGEARRQVPNGGSQPRKRLAREARNTPPHGLPIALRKPFHPLRAHIAGTAAGKGVDRIAVAERVEGLAEHQGGRLSDVEHAAPPTHPGVGGPTGINRKATDTSRRRGRSAR